MIITDTCNTLLAEQAFETSKNILTLEGGTSLNMPSLLPWTNLTNIHVHVAGHMQHRSQWPSMERCQLYYYRKGIPIWQVPWWLNNHKAPFFDYLDYEQTTEKE